jgi:TolB protein
MRKDLSRSSWKIGVTAAAFAAITLAAQSPPPQPAAPAPQQPSAIEVRINGESGAAPRYAVPDFVALTPDVADTAKMLGQVLWDDLAFEREFYMIPRDTSASIGVPRSAEQMNFDAWREIGADAVFFGTVAQKGDDILVQVRLFNVRTRQSAFAQEYTVRARSARQIAHIVSDAVLLQQTGITGVARTRITFISDRNNESVLGLSQQKRNVKEVYVTDYDGANQQRITSTRQLNLNPSWSGDARAIAYAGFRNDRGADILLSFIYTGVLQNLTNGRFPSGAATPAFAPDGKQVLFSATPPGAGAYDLWVMNVDGSNARRLTTHPASEVAATWSPSGTQIAFVSDRLGVGREQIYIINADGSGLYRLNIPDNQVDRPTWAPAPYNEIAYTARSGPGYDIKVHELGTGITRQLTFGEGTNESPAYSPSGRHIAFTSTRAGNIQVFTIGRDGNGLRQITRTGNNQTPDWSNAPGPAK